jgi:type VI secretion system secreted protein Hcp
MKAYMKINGVSGNVTANSFKDAIALTGVHFNVKRAMNTKPGAISDRQGTRPSFSEVTVTKEVDKASPILFRDATTGKPIPTVDIQFTHAGQNTNITHSVTLSNVLISGYELEHTEKTAVTDQEGKTEKDSDKPIEHITLNFTKMEIKNTPYDANNKAQSPVAAGYDLETAQLA